MCWAKPADLLGWRGGSNPRTVIIAGCSVLSVALSGPMVGPGLDWLPLIRARGGPVEDMLGYGATVPNPTSAQRQAPADNPVGNAVAEEIGKAISRGSNTLPSDWLEINAQHHAWNAVAIDRNATLWSMTQSIPFTTAHTVTQTPLP